MLQSTKTSNFPPKLCRRSSCAASDAGPLYRGHALDLYEHPLFLCAHEVPAWDVFYPRFRVTYKNALLKILMVDTSILLCCSSERTRRIASQCGMGMKRIWNLSRNEKLPGWGVFHIYTVRRYQMFSQTLLPIRRPGKWFPSTWRGAALWSKTSARMSMKRIWNLSRNEKLPGWGVFHIYS